MAAVLVRLQMRTKLGMAVATAIIVGIMLGGCTSSRRGDAMRVERTLDAFHDAASRADMAAYFAILDDDAVFLGTDATERWTATEFRAYCEPYFVQGRGWTYVPRERHVRVDDSGRVAWADEVLVNEKYGFCRGVSVLRRDDASRHGWRVRVYSLNFLIPNAIAADVTAKAKDATSTP